MRSALSQRPIVLAEGADSGSTVATCRARSVRLQQASGIPVWRGKLHDVAATWTRTSGEKRLGAPERRVSQTVGGHPASAPLADQPITGPRGLGDLLVIPVWMLMGG